MTVRSRRALCVALLVLAAACRKSSAPPSRDATTMASGPSDELAAVEAELAGNAQELQALGVVVAQKGSQTGNQLGGQTDKEAEEQRRERDDGSTKNTEPSAAPEPELDRDEERPSKPPADSPSPNAEPPAPPKPTTTTTSSIDACGRICALAGAACDLSQRICTLAEQHDGDARYEDLCWNAQRQCEAASDACADCSTC
jgi:hypothetical protein